MVIWLGRDEPRGLESAAQSAKQSLDVRAVFGPVQLLLVREHIGQPGEWQSLDDFRPINQVIGMPLF